MRAPLVAVIVLAVAVAAAALLLTREDPVAPAGMPAAPAPAADDAAMRALTDDTVAPGDRSAVARAAAPATADTAAGTVTLSGRLVQANGEPLADANLRFGPRIDLPTEGANTTTDRTDTAGRFALTVQAGRAGQLQLDDGAHVFADASDRGLAIEAMQGNRDLGDLAVVTGAAVHGTVRDAVGRPLAEVTVSMSRDGPLAGVGFGRWQTESAADGTFAFRALYAGDYRLSTASPRHLPASQSVALAAGETRRDLVLALSEGSSIAGVVVDDTGAPIADASVGAFRQRALGESGEITSLSADESVRTDANGRFSLGGLEDAPVTVRASAAAHAASSASGVRPGTANVTLTLARLATVRGRLVDRAGSPIEGSSISAEPAADGASGLRLLRSSARTDAAGSFELTDVAAGSVIITATGNDHVAVSSAPTQVRPGESVDGLRLVADRGATLAVRVVDTHGTPVAGADVVVREPPPRAAPGGAQIASRSIRRRVESGDEEISFDDGGPRRLGTATSDADGWARIGGLPAGAAVASVAHPDHAPSRPHDVEMPAAGVLEVSLALREAGIVQVTAVDADHQPLASADVVLTPADANGDDTRYDGTTDDAGVVEIRSLPAGRYVAALRRPSRPISVGGASIMMVDGNTTSYEASRADVAVEAGETSSVTLVRPVLTTVQGALRDAEGPVAGGKVEIARADAPTIQGLGGSANSAVTDAAGRFTVDGLTAGSYRIRFGRRGQVVLAEQELTLAGERFVERDLELNGGSVTIAVLDAEGTPLRRATVSLRRAGEDATSTSGPRRTGAVMVMMSTAGGSDGSETTMTLGGGPPSVKTDADGRATVRDVPPGVYTVAVSHSRHQRKELEAIEVQAQGEHDLGGVQLSGAGAISGTIEVADGDVPLVTNVQAKRADGTGEPQTSMAMRGAFRFEGLGPGRYELRARPVGPNAAQEWGAPEIVEVEAGRSSRVTLRL